MAVEEIDQAYVIEFSANVHKAAQQIRARLRPYVMIQQMKGEKFAYDGLGLVEARELSGRHQPIQFSDIDHNRRRITRRRFAVVLPIDAGDVRSMLNDPQGEYAQSCVRAIERVFDRIVCEAQFASVYTGKDMDTAVTFANDNGTTVTATAGLTYEKLLEAIENFIDNEVGNDVPEKLVMGISGNEHTALMKETELVSGDFSRQYVIDKGRITSGVGLDFVLFSGGATQPILSVTSSVRSCFVMSTRAMCVGMSKEISVKVEPRPDLHETKQVVVEFDFGAVRTEGKLIQKVTTTSS